MTGINRNKRNIELCRRIRERDPEAETRMLLENDRLIIQMAMDIKVRRGIASSDGIDEEDLMQVGRIAICSLKGYIKRQSLRAASPIPCSLTKTVTCTPVKVERASSAQRSTARR